MIKVGIVASLTTYEYIKRVIPDSKDEYEVIYLKYSNINEVEKICYENINRVDAYIFGGEYIYQVIKDKSLHEKIPCSYLQQDVKGELYKLLLKLYIENKDLDLSRAYIDGIDENNHYLCLKDVIPPENFPYTFSFPFDENYFQKLEDTHLRLWNEGAIDISITRSGSIEARLKEAGIKAYYLPPSEQSIINTFNTVINNFKINHLINNQIAIGNISLSRANIGTKLFDYETEMKQLKLYQALIDFSKEYGISYIIEKYDFGFEIFISKGILNELTYKYSHCRLLEYLKASVSFKVNIGWGVGINLKTARQNAQYANIEADRHGGNCSFVITEQEDRIGPLSDKNCLTYNNSKNIDVSEISRQTKLSPSTIQKLLGIIEQVKTNELSASDLAYYLRITERSANRIIAKLEKNGNAVALYTKSDKLRGRPKKIYAIQIPTDII